MKIGYFLLLGTLSVVVQAVVERIRDLDQFYDVVNDYNESVSRYTVVKYYTNWCSHCKKLGPVFAELSELDGTKEFSEFQHSTGSEVEFKFLEVDCDLFGSTLCKRLDGFPMVEVVKPLRSEFTVCEDNEESLSFFGNIWRKVSRGGYNPKWVLDTNRVVTFKGRRDLGVLQEFVVRIAKKEQLERIVDDVLNNRCRSSDGLCVSVSDYLSQVLDYEQEIRELEKVIYSDEEFSMETRLKYMLLDRVYSQEQIPESDEL